jgi:hypothetical protein
MGNASASEKVSQQISRTHLNMIMENMLDCTAKSNQNFDFNMQVAGDLDLSQLNVDMKGVQ